MLSSNDTERPLRIVSIREGRIDVSNETGARLDFGRTTIFFLLNDRIRVHEMVWCDCHSIEFVGVGRTHSLALIDWWVQARRKQHSLPTASISKFIQELKNETEALST